jgi:hypothetical protein
MKNNVLIFPASTDENEYIDNMRNIFSSNGFKVVNLSPRDVIKSYFVDNKYAYVNWIENQTRERGLLGFALIVGFYFILKILGYKIVWVRHNSTSHNLLGRWQFYLNKVAIKFLEKYSKVVMCHGLNFSKKSNYKYIPHPLYKVDVEKSEVVGVLEYYLIFGRIVPYKRVEAFLSECNSCNLIIAGKFDSDYKNMLMPLIERSKAVVDIQDRYIPNLELDNLIAGSQGVIITNDGDTSIVSGVVFRSLELGACVITNSSRLYQEIGPLAGLSLVGSWSSLELPICSGGLPIKEVHSDGHVMQAFMEGVNGKVNY